MSFHIGQKVVCVDDRDGPPYQLLPRSRYIGTLDGLKRGSVYTVRDILDHWDGTKNCLRLEEIHRRNHPVQNDSPYNPARFRAIQEKPASIEIFREIARGVSDGKPVVEDAEYRSPTPEKVRA